MPDVTINLLAGFSAAVDGTPVEPGAWRLRKARDLVKLLALAPGRSLHREQAMDALWREHAPSAAANNLYQAVHAARRALDSGALEFRDEMLSLAGDVTVDVDVFEAAARRALDTPTAASLRAALDLYAGDLLPENRYDEWALEPRERLADLRDRLADELAEVGTETVARGLPADASSFVGRDRELGELRSLLARTRLLTLSGTGGAGKTRLALELARGAEAGYADGAVLVELASVADPATVPVAVAALLDVRALPEQPLVDAIASYLARRTLLLVLDNCEHVIGASAELTDSILRSAPDVTVLATSREPLRVPGEVVFRVPSLAIPNPEHVTSPDQLLRYEAVRLFVERAQSTLPGFELDERNAGDVARICFRLDGLPLALELAAGRLGALSPAAVSERLDDRFRLLQAGSRTAPTRQQTLLATLNWSHDLLDDDERVLLRRLAIFSGGFDLDAVEAVCTGPDFECEALADLLARLVEKSLVTAGDVDGEWRYGLLDTVGAFATERLAEAGEPGELALRHARWATELAEREAESPRLDREAANFRRALSTLVDREPREALRFCVAVWPFWLRRIDLGEAQRRFAVALAAEPERSILRMEALRAAASMDFRGGTMLRGMERAEEAHAIAEQLGDARAEWRTLQLLGEFTLATDNLERAPHWLERGLAVARREGFAGEEALGVYTHGVERWLDGDLGAAESLVTESLDRLRAVNNRSATIPSPLGISEMRIGDPERPAPASVVFQDSLQIFAELQCDAAVGYVQTNLASLVWQRGETERALSLVDDAAAHFTALEDERGLAYALARRGQLRLEGGELESALSDLERALEIRGRLHDRRGVGLALSALARVDTIAGNLPRAERRVSEACDLFRRAGDRWGLASALWRLTDLRCIQGRLDEAWQISDEVRRFLLEIERPRWIGHSQSISGEIAWLRGDRDTAVALFTDAAATYRGAHDRNGAEIADRWLAAIAQTAQRPRKGAGDTNVRKRSTKGHRT